VWYLAASGYTRTDIETKSDLNVDNLDLQGFLVSPAITENDLLAGLWDYAAIEIFTVNYADLTMGKMIERTGHIGQVTLDRDQFTAELRGLMQAYTRSIGRIESPACNANLGDARCKIQLAPAGWQASTVYATGDVVSALTSVVSYHRRFQCVIGGTTGSTEPLWDPILGSETTDGSVIWVAMAGFTVAGTVDSVNADALTIYDSERDEAGPTDTRAVTGVTNANPGVISYASAFDPPLTAGEAVIISGVVGPASINVVTVVLNPSTTSFELNVDTTDTIDYPAYVSGGTISRFGDSGFFDGGVMTASLSKILPAMTGHGVQRLVLLSALGLGDGVEKAPLLITLVGRSLLRRGAADKRASERLVRSTDLDWLSVYPGALTGGKGRGSYRLNPAGSIRGFPRIARADVARCMLDEVEHPTVHKAAAAVVASR